MWLESRYHGDCTHHVSVCGASLLTDSYTLIVLTAWLLLAAHLTEACWNMMRICRLIKRSTSLSIDLCMYWFSWPLKQPSFNYLILISARVPPEAEQSNTQTRKRDYFCKSFWQMTIDPNYETSTPAIDNIHPLLQQSVKQIALGTKSCDWKKTIWNLYLLWK